MADRASLRCSGARLRPFKVHTATLPVDGQNRLLPVDSQTFWGNGTLPGATGFVNTTRYMALYHQVAPKSQAENACVICHRNGPPDD